MKKILFNFTFNIFLINKSFALIEIDITRGNLDPLPIAISPSMLILNQMSMKV